MEDERTNQQSLILVRKIDILCDYPEVLMWCPPTVQPIYHTFLHHHTPKLDWLTVSANPLWTQQTLNHPLIVWSMAKLASAEAHWCDADPCKIRLNQAIWLSKQQLTSS